MSHMNIMAAGWLPSWSLLVVISWWLMPSIFAFASSRSAVASLAPPANVVESPQLYFQLRTRALSNINDTKILFQPSFTGATLPQSTRTDGLLQINIMLPHKDDDITGCSGPWRTMNEFNQTYEQSFILLMVGACSAINTYNVAASSGALGMIVYGCPPEPPYNCESRLVNVFSLVPESAPLPVAIAITSASGHLMVQYLKANLISTSPPPKDALQMLIRSSGPLVPEERAALIAIANQTTMGNFVGGPSLSLPPWSVERFQDLSLDPCLNRTMGLWCELGHLVLIDVYYMSWTTISSIPSEFGSFTHLKYLSDIGDSFSGDIPAAWCNMTQLQMLRFQQQVGGGITSLPDCIGASWTKLRHLQLDGNSLTSLPDSLSQLSSLEIIRMGNNFIHSVPALASLTQLVIVDFGSNAITSIPLFSPFATNLQQIGFSSNRIIAPIPPTAFDGMTELQVIDLNTNHLSGSLPNFSGCINLQIIDFSSQRNLTTNQGGFTGSIPASWSSLINLKEMYLQENSLTSPIYSSGLLSLQRIDLSHNYLTNAIPTNLFNTDPAGFLDTVLGPSVISMKLSYNLLSGSFVRSPGVILTKTMNELYLDHNQFTNIFSGFFQGTSPFTTIDFSYNNISLPSDAFPDGTPALRMVYMNFRGNPYMHVSQLPSWVVVGSILTEELGQPYTCAEFTATTAPLLDFRVDPGFWSYQHCQCNQGTFGRPPLCHSVPNAAILQPDHVITSSEIGDDFAALIASVRSVGSALTVPTTGNYSHAFSDGMYGENRLTLGISTVWVIDVTSQFADDPDAYLMAGLAAPVPIETYRINTTTETPSSLWTPVRVITVRLHVSATQFSTFDDVISIYEGPSDLKGSRVYTMRGTDTKSLIRSTVYTTSPEYLLEHNASISQVSDPRLYEIQVFSPMASVQFTSRAISGLHFYATYSYDFACPDGYFYNRDVSPNQCHLNYEEYHVGLPIRSAVFALSGLTLVFVLINIVILALFWSSPVYKAASRVFMAIMLVFLFFMGLGSLLYASIPHVDSVGSAICIGRGWLTCLPLTVLLGVFLAKANRLDTIFGATTLQVKKITDLDIGRTVLLVCSVQIVLLAIYSGLPLSRAQLAVGKGNLGDRLVYSCSQESGFMIWVGIEIAYIACLMLPAAYLGYKTRNLPSQYVESSHIQNAIILLIFFGIIIIPLDFFIQDSPEAAVLIQGLGQAFMCMMMTAIIFGPKLYYLSLVHRRLGGGGGGAAPKTPPDTVNTAVTASENVSQPQITPPQQLHHGLLLPQQNPPRQPGPPRKHPLGPPNYVLPDVYRSHIMISGTGKPPPLPLAVNPGLISRPKLVAAPMAVAMAPSLNQNGSDSRLPVPHAEAKCLPSLSTSSQTPNTNTSTTTTDGAENGDVAAPNNSSRAPPAEIELVSAVIKPQTMGQTAATSDAEAGLATAHTTSATPISSTTLTNGHSPVEANTDGIHLIISHQPPDADHLLVPSSPAAPHVDTV